MVPLEEKGVVSCISVGKKPNGYDYFQLIMKFRLSKTYDPSKTFILLKIISKHQNIYMYSLIN